MRIIHIQARCPNAFSELSGASGQDVSLAIESLVSVALLELCGEVTMDYVWVTNEAHEADEADEAHEAEARPSGVASRHGE